MNVTNFKAETHYFILCFLGGTSNGVQNEKKVMFEIWLGVVFQCNITGNHHNVNFRPVDLYYFPQVIAAKWDLAPNKRPILRKG